MATVLGLLDPEVEGAKILRNAGDCLPSNTASCQRQLESLAAFVPEPQIVHSSLFMDFFNTVLTSSWIT